jgi:ABC-type Fe3+-hydroxamate transport system substrate-binding protein
MSVAETGAGTAPTPRTNRFGRDVPTRDDGPVKIVSLLPSATEIVFALGLGDQLSGVSFECDYPPAARSVPVVSGTALPTDGSLSAEEIDAEVSARVAAGESIYTLDDARIRAIDPDLILAQDLCRVCAVPSGRCRRPSGSSVARPRWCPSIQVAWTTSSAALASWVRPPGPTIGPGN